MQTGFSEEQTILHYVIHLTSFEESSPASKWEEQITEYTNSEECKENREAGLSDWHFKLDNLYKQRREKEEKIRLAVNENMKANGRLPKAKKILKTFLQPHQAALDSDKVSLALWFSQTGELLQVAMLIHLKDAHAGEMLLSENQCQLLFDALDAIDIITPWEDRDCYRVRWTGDVDLYEVD